MKRKVNFRREGVKCNCTGTVRTRKGRITSKNKALFPVAMEKVKRQILTAMWATLVQVIP